MNATVLGDTHEKKKHQATILMAAMRTGTVPENTREKAITHQVHNISFHSFVRSSDIRTTHPFPPQHIHHLHPFPIPLPLLVLLLRNGTSSSSSKKQAGYASPFPITSAPIKLPKLVLQPPNTAAAVVGLANAVSSDQRLRSGFCWLAMVEPGEVDMDERQVVAVVAVELEERIRRGMRRV